MIAKVYGSVVVPFLIDLKSRTGAEEYFRVQMALNLLYSAPAVVFMLLVMVFGDFFVHLIAPNAPPETTALAVRALPMLAVPALALMGLEMGKVIPQPQQALPGRGHHADRQQPDPGRRGAALPGALGDLVALRRLRGRPDPAVRHHLGPGQEPGFRQDLQAGHLEGAGRPGVVDELDGLHRHVPGHDQLLPGENTSPPDLRSAAYRRSATHSSS
ncbi:MAG: hypothetical protein IPM94_06815 [bacterium]|nr:hypothetical protein [bacterium]